MDYKNDCNFVQSVVKNQPPPSCRNMSTSENKSIWNDLDSIENVHVGVGNTKHY